LKVFWRKKTEGSKQIIAQIGYGQLCRMEDKTDGNSPPAKVPYM